MSNFRVKALDWSPHPVFGGDDLAVAMVHLFGEHKYQAGRSSDSPGYKCFLAPTFGSWFWISDQHKTLEEAKSAAQEDYEKRIMSALEVSQ